MTTQPGIKPILTTGSHPDAPTTEEWRAVAEAIFLASRAYAEHEMASEFFERPGVTQAELELTRVAIAAGATACVRMLKSAGYLADLPSIPFEGTYPQQLAAVHGDRLRAWDEGKTNS